MGLHKKCGILRGEVPSLALSGGLMKSRVLKFRLLQRWYIAVSILP